MNDATTHHLLAILAVQLGCLAWLLANIVYVLNKIYKKLK